MKRIRKIFGVAKVLVVAGVLSLSAAVGAVKAAEKGDSSLVAYWNFDEGSGNVAKDISGNGHKGKFS